MWDWVWRHLGLVMVLTAFLTVVTVGLAVSAYMFVAGVEFDIGDAM